MKPCPKPRPLNVNDVGVVPGRPSASYLTRVQRSRMRCARLADGLGTRLGQNLLEDSSTRLLSVMNYTVDELPNELLHDTVVNLYSFHEHRESLA